MARDIVLPRNGETLRFFTKNDLGVPQLAMTIDKDGNVDIPSIDSSLTTDLLADDKIIPVGQTMSQDFLTIPVEKTLTVQGQFVGYEPTIDGDMVIEPGGEAIIL